MKIGMILTWNRWRCAFFFVLLWQNKQISDYYGKRKFMEDAQQDQILLWL